MDQPPNLPIPKQKKRILSWKIIILLIVLSAAISYSSAFIKHETRYPFIDNNLTCVFKNGGWPMAYQSEYVRTEPAKTSGITLGCTTGSRDFTFVFIANFLFWFAILLVITILLRIILLKKKNKT